MQPTTLLLVLQTISSLSIAGGLLFAAVQFRHGRKATHVANFTRLVELQMQLRRMRVDDPSLAAVYRHDMTGLQTDEQVRQYFFNLMQLSLFEIAWYSHKHGQLPDDYWQSWVDRMKTIQVEESFRQMMASPAMKILHNDFHKYVIDMMRETTPSPSLRESQRDIPVPPR